MATKFFPDSLVVPATSTFTTADTRLLDTLQGGSVLSTADATVATLVTAANPQGTGLVAPWKRAASITLAAAGTVETGAVIGASYFFVSKPIRANTISGTITANIRASESAAAANIAVGCKVYKVSGNAVTVAFAQGSNITEIGTSEAATSIALTPTSTAFAAGDRIGVIFYFCSPSGSTSTSGRTNTGFWNGAAGATGDTFLSFTETIVLVSSILPETRRIVRNSMLRR